MTTKGPKILIIDDDPDILRLLKKIIAGAFPEAKVFLSRNGEKGMEQALSESPDVILLDIMMPAMDGFTVCRKLKEGALTRLIPVIFMTGIYTDRENRVMALEAGGEAFLTKPFDDAELIAQIRAMVKIKAADESRLREELARVGRMAVLNELAASLAHEINQPLAAILSNTQSALRFLEAPKPDLDEVRDALKDIVDDNRRISTIIKELRDFIKKDGMKSEPLGMAGVIEEALILANSDLAIKDITVQKAFDANLPKVLGNRVQIQQVILNLVTNGCDAMEKAADPDRLLTIRACTDNNRDVLVEISDRGHGFSKTASGRLFEPFYTTKPNGLGLGLPTCKSIIESHGGAFFARNNPDKGATVGFSLPTEKSGP